MDNLKEKIAKRAGELTQILGISPEECAKIEENLNTVYTAPKITAESAAKAIDHTILTFNATESDVLKICREARDFAFKAICINPVWIKTAFDFRKNEGAEFRIATVIDFPLGASTAAVKEAETRQAVLDGADECDVVINIGLIKSNRLKECFDILKSAVKTKTYIKVILETSALLEEEKIDAVLIALFAGADMLKTSTGVNGKATIEDVKLLRMIAGNKLGVKAAGGIRDKETLIAMMEAGADRIGCSSSVSIMENW